MRERAERIGAGFKIRSRAAAGTEIELTVPGIVAFERSAGSFPRLDRATASERPAHRADDRTENDV